MSGGVVEAEDVGKSGYVEVLKQVRQAGLLERQTRYYVVKIVANLLSQVIGWAALVFLGDSWWQLLTAAYLAFTFGQSAIVGHDAGHWQITRSDRLRCLIGYIHMNFAIGLSFGWWIERHRRHHVNPNDTIKDPDAVSGFLGFTPSQVQEKGGLGRFLCKYQAFLLLPAMFVAQSPSMHWNHARQLISTRFARRPLEMLLLLAHAILYLIVVLAVLSPVRALVFVLVQQGLFGSYLGAIIAPNHKGMQMFGSQGPREFLTRQVESSRNILGGRLVEGFFGGLNYQIEHHLFPTMSIPCLRKARPIVRSYCAQNGLVYVETGIIDSYKQALLSLHRAGRVALTGFHD